MNECKACRHRDRLALDNQLVRGTPFREMAANFGLSLSCVSRHRHHVHKELRDAARAERMTHGVDLLGEAQSLLASAKELLTDCKKAKDRRNGIAAIGAAAKVLTLLGTASGQLHGTNLHLHAHTERGLDSGTVDDTLELAEFIRDATNGWDEEKLRELMALAPRLNVLRLAAPQEIVLSDSGNQPEAPPEGTEQQ